MKRLRCMGKPATRRSRERKPSGAISERDDSDGADEAGANSDAHLSPTCKLVRPWEGQPARYPQTDLWMASHYGESMGGCQRSPNRGQVPGRIPGDHLTA